MPKQKTTDKIRKDPKGYYESLRKERCNREVTYKNVDRKAVYRFYMYIKTDGKIGWDPHDAGNVKNRKGEFERAINYFSWYNFTKVSGISYGTIKSLLLFSSHLAVIIVLQNLALCAIQLHKRNMEIEDPGDIHTEIALEEQEERPQDEDDDECASNEDEGEDEYASNENGGEVHEDEDEASAMSIRQKRHVQAQGQNEANSRVQPAPVRNGVIPVRPKPCVQDQDQDRDQAQNEVHSHARPAPVRNGVIQRDPNTSKESQNRHEKTHGGNSWRSNEVETKTTDRVDPNVDTRNRNVSATVDSKADAGANEDIHLGDRGAETNATRVLESKKLITDLGETFMRDLVAVGETLGKLAAEEQMLYSRRENELQLQYGIEKSNYEKKLKLLGEECNEKALQYQDMKTNYQELQSKNQELESEKKEMMETIRVLREGKGTKRRRVQLGADESGNISSKTNRLGTSKQIFVDLFFVYLC